MGYSPWGRKESDTTERLHSLKTVGCSEKMTLTFFFATLFFN